METDAKQRNRLQLRPLWQWQLRKPARCALLVETGAHWEPIASRTVCECGGLDVLFQGDRERFWVFLQRARQRLAEDGLRFAWVVLARPEKDAKRQAHFATALLGSGGKISVRVFYSSSAGS
jgi:hypothetical protein